MVPGCLIVMTPAQLHMHWLLLVRTDIFPAVTVGAPGTQGAEVAGTQGMGVKTPIAAEVAEATVGFAMDLHTPKDGMFAMGLKSMVVAAGFLSIITICPGRMVSGAGAAPIEHWRSAPVVTKSGMGSTYVGEPVSCKALSGSVTVSV